MTTMIFDEAKAQSEFRGIVRTAADVGMFKNKPVERAFIDAAITYTLARFVSLKDLKISKKELVNFLAVVGPALTQERDATIRAIKECNN